MLKINYLFVSENGSLIFEYDGLYYIAYKEDKNIKIGNLNKFVLSIDQYELNIKGLRKVVEYDLDKYRDLIMYIESNFFEKLEEENLKVEYKKRKREVLIDIFRNTDGFCKNEESLQESIKDSMRGTKVYIENFKATRKFKYNEPCKVVINSNRTLKEARKILKENPMYNVAVLNFANAFNGGGTVLKGSSSQEEAICRCSTLYSCIHVSDALLEGEYSDYFNYINEGYYAYNKRLNKASKRVIYTPDVTVFKDDIGYPKVLDKKEWYKINVISCAANNQGELKLREKEEFENINDKIRTIFEVALDNNIDVLVLGAFGCGAFKNDPYVVAKAFLQKYSYIQASF